VKRNTIVSVTAGLVAGVSLASLVAAAPSWALFGSAPAAGSVLAPVVGQVSALAAGQVTRWGNTPNLADMVEHVSPSVVQVIVRQSASTRMTSNDGANPFEGTPFEDFFGRQFRGGQGNQQREMPDRMGSGSGFFIEGGYIVTNNHVVDGAKKVTVRFDDGSDVPATVVGTDEKTDLAVIKVDGKSVRPALGWGNSNQARPGESVFAVGSPFGLGNTVTAGIVSARGRQIGGQYDDYIQVDAPINQGNSGGPLFDQTGRVIGVNSAIYSPTGGNVGIGFSIPSEVAQGIVQQIITHGTVERGWLGVSIGNVSPDIAHSLGIDATKGAFVNEVTDNSPASRAGLKERDIILSFGDREIGHIQDLTRAVADTRAGTTKDVKILRGGKVQTIKVRIDALKADTDNPVKPAKADDGDSVSSSGSALKLSELGLDVTTDNGAAVISDVKVNSPAGDLGLKEGDKIVMVNDTPVKSADAVKAAVDAAKKQRREAVLLQVDRNGRKNFIGVPFSTD
jgi:serine protease Do